MEIGNPEFAEYHSQQVLTRPETVFLPLIRLQQRGGFSLCHMYILMHTRRYGPLRGPTSSSCGGLRPSAEAFFALRAKKELIMGGSPERYTRTDGNPRV